MNNKKFLIFSSIVLALALVLTLNAAFDPQVAGVLQGLSYGDISAAMTLDPYMIAKITALMTGQTWVLSAGFYYVSKKVL